MHRRDRMRQHHYTRVDVRTSALKSLPRVSAVLEGAHEFRKGAPRAHGLSASGFSVSGCAGAPAPQCLLASGAGGCGDARSRRGDLCRPALALDGAPALQQGTQPVQGLLLLCTVLPDARLPMMGWPLIGGFCCQPAEPTLSFVRKPALHGAGNASAYREPRHVRFGVRDLVRRHADRR
jgi:hypothetical protein